MSHRYDNSVIDEFNFKQENINFSVYQLSSISIANFFHFNFVSCIQIQIVCIWQVFKKTYLLQLHQRINDSRE
jgi:hypothetical protein